MGKVLRIVLPGYRADTDTDPDHYAVFTQDTGDEYILIKEKERNSISVPANSFVTISHGLGYVPLAFVFWGSGVNRWKKAYGYSVEDLTAPYWSIGTTLVEFNNPTNAPILFKYYIFYDKFTQ